MAGGFDLNNPLDFAQKVVGSAAGLLSNFAGGDPSEWDIQEASYNDVVFHVFESKQDWSGGVGQVQDSGGRRKVKYSFPYRDGQTTDDLGRAADTFSINVILHGTNYLQGYARLFRELNKPQPGILVHPVRGRIRCTLEEYQITHESTQRKAMTLQLTFIEHNFDAGTIAVQEIDRSVKSALQTALEAFAEIENLILKVRGTINFVQAVKNNLIDFINLFKNNYAQTLGRMNGTFNQGTSDDIPGLLPANLGGNLGDGGVSTGDTFPAASSPSDPFQQVPVSTVRENSSIARTVKELEEETNARRAEINRIIRTLESNLNSSLEFNEDIINLKGTAVRLQQVLETGKASSNAFVIDYVVPRTMSIREVAFANNVNLERVNEIEELNPDLTSYNFIAKDTLMKVPS